MQGGRDGEDKAGKDGSFKRKQKAHCQSHANFSIFSLNLKLTYPMVIPNYAVTVCGYLEFVSDTSGSA